MKGRRNKGQLIGRFSNNSIGLRRFLPGQGCLLKSKSSFRGILHLAEMDPPQYPYYAHSLADSSVWEEWAPHHLAVDSGRSTRRHRQLCSLQQLYLTLLVSFSLQILKAGDLSITFFLPKSVLRAKRNRRVEELNMYFIIIQVNASSFTVQCIRH